MPQYQMLKPFKLLCIVLALALPAVLLACGSDEPSDGAVSTPVQSESGVERTTPTSGGADPTASPVPTPKPTATPMPGGGADPTATTAERSGPTSVNSDLSASKYDDYCGELSAISIEEGLVVETWGEAARISARTVERLEDIAPPDELKGLHNAQIAIYKGFYDFFRSEDENKPYSAEDFNIDNHPILNSLMTEFANAYQEVLFQLGTQLGIRDCGFFSFG